MNHMNKEYIKDLYKKYKDEVVELNKYIQEIRTSHNLLPHFDDIEKEITYMRIRELKPKNIIEFSPHGGYSTIIMSFAVKKNMNNGKIKTYDVVDLCTRNIESLGYTDIVEFILGDCRNRFGEMMGADYLFIDSDHSPEFTNQYIENLLEPIYKNYYIPGSCHDVLHSCNPVRLSSEGDIIINFLNKKNINFYGPNNDVQELTHFRNSLGIFDFHQHWCNSIIFF